MINQPLISTRRNMMTTHNNDEKTIYTAVADRYSRIATGEESSCGTPTANQQSCCGPTEADVLFSDVYTTDTSHLPADITDLSLGCGDPITLAALTPGQVVLDLGSGGGIDCFLAAERVGETGHVIGVDMTPAMLAKAEANKAKLGVENVDFRQGQIEALPVEDTAVDVIISNCVVNLSPNKPQVLREAFRVLKPGGKLAISDTVTSRPLTPDLQADLGAWTECVSGAETVDFMARELAAAGFSDIEIRDRQHPERNLATDGLPADASVLISAHIVAYKPA